MSFKTNICDPLLVKYTVLVSDGVSGRGVCVRDGVSGRGVCVREMGCLGGVCVCERER